LYFITVRDIVELQRVRWRHSVCSPSTELICGSGTERETLLSMKPLLPVGKISFFGSYELQVGVVELEAAAVFLTELGLPVS